MPPSRPIASIDLPSGGRLSGFVNPDASSFDCAAIANLQTQVAPLIALMSCQTKILGLLKPLIEVIKELPNPSPEAIAQFASAAADLAPCLASSSPTGVLPFLRNLLCLQIQSLNCVSRRLQALATLAAGNSGAVSPAQWQNLMEAYTSIAGIFELAAWLFQTAGVNLPAPPSLNFQTNLSLAESQNALTQFTQTLQLVTDALGGCS